MTVRKDERGAVAVMVGLLSVVLLSVAGVAVDLGNAMAQRAEVRKVTDLAALAGGSGTNLPGPISGACSTGYIGQKPDPLGQAVLDAAASLSQTTWSGVSPTADTLTDCSLSNGEVVYGRLTFPASGTPTLTYDPTKLTVYSPPRDVQFGMAGVMGFDSTTVGGHATVAAGTPGSSKVFPAFATEGCDWGQRTIFAPATVNSNSSFTPDLASPTDTNITTFDTTSQNPSPNSVPVNPPSALITLTGTDLDTVTQVGFFKEGSPGTIVETLAKADFASQSATQITFTTDKIPTNVTSASSLWWIRVWAPKQSRTDTTFKWSEVKSGQDLKTLPFSVGESYLRCAGVAAGSYGDVILPRTDSNSADWNAMNMARNLQVGPPTLTLRTYPGSATSIFGVSTAPNLCDPADSRTVYSGVTGNSAVLKENTNCVDNGTGLTANTATDGLIGGVGTYPGRLAATASTTCGSTRSVTVNGANASTSKVVSINNDYLSCFFTDSSATVGPIAQKSYSGPPVLSCAVFDSPRFFYQPVLQVRPSGGSSHYSIVDFRPAFITEQDPAGTKAVPLVLANNGITITNNSLTQLDVLFFNPKALPDDCPNAFGPSLGGTTKTVVRLVD